MRSEDCKSYERPRRDQNFLYRADYYIYIECQISKYCFQYESGGTTVGSRSRPDLINTRYEQVVAPEEENNNNDICKPSPTMISSYPRPCLTYLGEDYKQCPETNNGTVRRDNQIFSKYVVNVEGEIERTVVAEDADLADSKTDWEEEEIDGSKPSIEEKEINQTKSDLEEKEIDESKSYEGEKEINKPYSDLEGKEADESKPYIKMKEINKTKSDLEEKEINDPRTDQEEEEIDGSNFYMEESKIDKPNSDIEEKDTDESKTNLEEQEMDEPDPDLNKENDEAKSDLKGRVVYKTNSDLEEKEIDETRCVLDTIKLSDQLIFGAVSRRHSFCNDSPKTFSVKETKGIGKCRNDVQGMTRALSMEQMPVAVINKSSSYKGLTDKKTPKHNLFTSDKNGLVASKMDDDVKGVHAEEMSFESSKDRPCFLGTSVMKIQDVDPSPKEIKNLENDERRRMNSLYPSSQEEQCPCSVNEAGIVRDTIHKLSKDKKNSKQKVKDILQKSKDPFQKVKDHNISSIQKDGPSTKSKHSLIHSEYLPNYWDRMYDTEVKQRSEELSGYLNCNQRGGECFEDNDGGATNISNRANEVSPINELTHNSFICSLKPIDSDYDISVKEVKNVRGELQTEVRGELQAEGKLETEVRGELQTNLFVNESNTTTVSGNSMLTHSKQKQEFTVMQKGVKIYFEQPIKETNKMGIDQYSYQIISETNSVLESEDSGSLYPEQFADLRSCPVHNGVQQLITNQTDNRQTLDNKEFPVSRKLTDGEILGRKSKVTNVYWKRKDRKRKDKKNFNRTCLSSHLQPPLPVPVSNRNNRRRMNKVNKDQKNCGKQRKLNKPRRLYYKIKQLLPVNRELGCKTFKSQVVSEVDPGIYSLIMSISTCHDRRLNKSGRLCQKARKLAICGISLEHAHREFGFEKIQSQVISEVNSKIYPSLVAIRSYIENYFKSTASKEKSLERTKFSKLESLNSDLNAILQSLERAVFRNTHHSNTAIILPGLQSFFDSLRNGETPSLQERMRYEWLRLMSYSSYTGNGSPVNLARNGFHHLSGTETRCFCCNVSYSSWTYNANVQEIHRIISPNCPFVNGGNESNGNISVEARSVQNEPNQIIQENLENASTQRPAGSANHRRSSFGTGVGFPNGCESTSGATTAMGTRFNISTASARINAFGLRYQTNGATGSNQDSQPMCTVASTLASANSNAQRTSCLQSVNQHTGDADITTQLAGLTGALTIQQPRRAQQGYDDPESGSPVISLNQPNRTLREADGVAAKLLEMGFTQDRAREAVLTVRRLTGRFEVSIEEVLDWMLDDDSAPREETDNIGATGGGGYAGFVPSGRQSAVSMSSSHHRSEAVGKLSSDSHTFTKEAQSTKTNAEGDTGGAKARDNLARSKSSRDDKLSKENSSSGIKSTKDKKAQSERYKPKEDRESRARKEYPRGPSRETASLSYGDVDKKHLKKENRLLKKMLFCKICKENYVNVTFLPCGHLVCCEDCAKSMRRCPDCRKMIKGQVRTFML